MILNSLIILNQDMKLFLHKHLLKDSPLMTMQMNLRSLSQLKKHPKKIFKLVPISKLQMISLVIQYSHQVPIHSWKSLWLENSGKAVRTLLTVMASLSSKLYSLVARTTILKSESSLEVIIHIQLLPSYSIKLSRIIMDMLRALNITVIWISLSYNAHPLLPKRPNTSKAQESESVETWLIIH